MNNAKMWLVVNPTVGVPLFLTAVAVSSFAVHLAVLQNTTWLPKYYANNKAAEQSADVAMSTVTPNVPASGNATVVFDGAQLVGTAQHGVVVLPDGRTARVVFDEPRVIEGSKTASLN